MSAASEEPALAPTRRTRAVLRAAARTRRAALSEEARASAAAAIAPHLLNAARAHHTIAAYAPFGGELDILTPLLRALPDAPWTLCLPRILGPGEMEFAPVPDAATLRPGAYGILAPTTPACALRDISLFLVPGVRFDTRGGRLGMGGGYYDRALEARQQHTPRAVILGVAYAWQVDEASLPAEAHDVFMDALLTEQGPLAAHR